MFPDLLRSRVQARLDALHINPFEAERRAGLKRGYVNDLLIGKKETFRQKAIGKLAAALECDPGFLLGTQVVPVLGGDAFGVRLAGIAEAGAWRDPEAEAVPDTPLPILPDPRYDPASLMFFLVRGDHAAGIGITAGSVVTVLTGVEDFREGDVVLAKRSASDGSVEYSVRVLAGGALCARPLKNSIAPIQLGAAEICGRVVTATRVFGLSS